MKEQLERMLKSWTDDARELESTNRGLYEEGKLVGMLKCISGLREVLNE